MIRTQYSDDVLTALAQLRNAAAHSDDISNTLARAFQKLDNAGVFADLDEQTDYASAEEILAESAREDLAKMQRVADLGPLERVPGTDTLRPARQTLVSDALRLDEEQAPVAEPSYRDCTCGRPFQTSPALHSGECPVWAAHHNLT